MLKINPYNYRILMYPVIFLFFLNPTITNGQNLTADTTQIRLLLQEARALTAQKEYLSSNQKAEKAAQLAQKHQKNSLLWNAIYAQFWNAYPTNTYNPLLTAANSALETVPTDSLILRGRYHDLMGFCYSQTGDVNKSFFHFQLSSRIWEQQNDKVRLAKAYNNLSINTTQRGDYERAYAYTHKSLLLNIELKNTFEIAKNYNTLGTCLNHMKLYDKAIVSYKKSHEYHDKKSGYFEFSIAEVEYNRANYTTALDYVTAAIEFNGEEDLAELYYLKGQIYTAQKEYIKAQKYYEDAIYLMQKYDTENFRELAKIHYHFGVMHQEIGNTKVALIHYQKTLQLFIPNFKPKDLFANPTLNQLSSEIWLMEALRSKGDVFYQQFENTQDASQLSLAIENYELAINFIQKIKLEYQEENSKSFLGEYTVPFYERAIQAQLAYYSLTKNPQYQAKAFETAQQSKAFVLREIVSEAQAMQLAGISEDALAEFTILQNQLAKLDIELTNTVAEKKDSLVALRFDINQQREKMKQSFVTDYPKYAALRHDLAPVSITDIQANISETALVLNYFQGEETGYIFAISKNKHEVFNFSISDDFEQNIQQFRRSTSDYDFIEKEGTLAEKQFLASGHQLYKLLLEKPLQQLRTPENQQLIIIPDGLLNHISFDVLLTAPRDSWLDASAFLLKKYAVSYAYYAKLLTQKKTFDKQEADLFAGFGLEYDDYTLEQVNKLNKDTLQNPFLPHFRSAKMGKLPYSDDEVLKISELLGGRVWLNEKVTKTNFLQNTSDARIIHLAAHGYVDLENPENSSLIFTKTAEDTTHLLQLAEIYNLDLSAEMVVLSACNTGYGALQKGEGVMSLSRAFNSAGVPSVVASLWSIPDNSTHHIMQLFYQNLKAGLSKGMALQQAKLSYLSDDNISSPATRLPVYWAATTVIGQVNPIIINELNPINYIVLGAFLLGLLLILFVFFRKKAR